MPEGITSKVRLFADDTIAYLTISSDQDARTLQSDLDKLTKWETSWKEMVTKQTAKSYICILANSK
jgi:hypothetical protein